MSNRQEYELEIHESFFKIKCHENQTTAFQVFFEDIMERVDESFIRVKPHGSIGDWKCDGFSENTGTVYQCYSPETPEMKTTLSKLEDDFLGAKSWWKDKMKKWVFVYSDRNELPAPVLNFVLELQKQHTEVIIETWNRPKLWNIVKELNLAHRNVLLGAIPSISDAPKVTSAEIEVLMNFMIEQGHVEKGNDMSLTGLSEKIGKNRLETMITTIQASVGVSKTVENYISRHPDTLYSSKVAGALVQKYKELVSVYGNNTEQIYWGLIRFVGRNLEDHKMLWPAAGIITYYFQLCDIFDR